MAYYSDLKLKLLDDLCDKLDASGIEGNVIERDSCGRPYVNIWYGSFNDHSWHLSEMFTVIVTDDSVYSDLRGCYEIKPPNKYYDYFKDMFMDRISRRSGFYVMGSDQIVRTIKFLFNREKMEKKKENNMKEFTLETVLFGKLKDKGIYYKFNNGVYNPREIIITTRMNYNICRVKSIPDPDDLRSYWVDWSAGIPAKILDDLNINRTTYYDWSEELIEDILKIEKKLTERLFGKTYDLITYDLITPFIKEKFVIKDVIFNDPATIVIWADGSKTVVKANGEKFDPEKGLAMAISKKVLGNKHDYYDVFKKYVGRYEKKQKKITR